MANKDNKTQGAEASKITANNAGDNSDGTDRTSALGGAETNTGSEAAAERSPAAAPGTAATLDPESDAGKAAASDKDHSGGAIRAEDNTDAGAGQPAEAAPAGTDPSVSEKITVKTSGPFMLQDPYTLDSMTEEPTEVVKSAFVIDRLASGQLVEA